MLSCKRREASTIFYFSRSLKYKVETKVKQKTFIICKKLQEKSRRQKSRRSAFHDLACLGSDSSLQRIQLPETNGCCNVITPQALTTETNSTRNSRTSGLLLFPSMPGVHQELKMNTVKILTSNVPLQFKSLSPSRLWNFFPPEVLC